ncbi:Mitochondrial distribution and morphology protein 31, mitochondrial precursor [Tulasnella sp. 419]|nr:Mitochondrial distribution and morphology protein 31, mitochondrial precursor [Tulasnella sp. 419]
MKESTKIGHLRSQLLPPFTAPSRSTTFNVSHPHVQKRLCDVPLRRMFSSKVDGSNKDEDSRKSNKESHHSSTKSNEVPGKPPEKDNHGQPPAVDPEHHPNLQNYSQFFRRLALSLPHLHRPTRDDFLEITESMWQRFKIRFKWFTIKSFRKFNVDDMSAFLSWFLVGQTLWIFVGTTTFVSVVLLVANSLRMQEYIARAISDYLTSETGVVIVFESAIVPKWKDSRICFQNVFVSRRPGNKPVSQPSQGSGSNEAARLLNAGHHDHDHDQDEEPTVAPAISHTTDESQWTYFDINIDSVAVTLSLWRWWNGKGLVTDAEIRGVRGVVDRRHLNMEDDYGDPASWRYTAQPGDFELESMKLEDILLTIYQPNFRPYTASVFRADLKHFRKRWLFYDLLSADYMVGQFDNCLFSLHKPQSIDRTMESDMKDARWKRMSRFRIDGVNIDHMQSMTGNEGPIAWITSGKVDAVLDIRFGREPSDDVDIQALLGEIAASISAVTQNGSRTDPDPPRPPPAERIPGQRELARPALVAPDDYSSQDTPSQVAIDIDLRFRDLKAAVPLFTSDLSYVNNALIRPIVAFINANRTLVPIHSRITKDLADFDGSWTLWQTGLSDEIALKVYDALAYHVANANQRRAKLVSLWGMRMTAHALITALRNISDSNSPRSTV